MMQVAVGLDVKQKPRDAGLLFCLGAAALPTGLRSFVTVAGKVSAATALSSTLLTIAAAFRLLLPRRALLSALHILILVALLPSLDVLFVASTLLGHFLLLAYLRPRTRTKLDAECSAKRRHATSHDCRYVIGREVTQRALDLRASFSS